jgi:WXG100 family type VII secretion target
MAGNIRIAPEELRDAAAFIENRKTTIEGCVKDLRSKIDEISANMEGQASTAFLDGFNDMYPTLSQDFPAVLEGIKTQLNTIAQVMEEADAQLQQALRG